MKGTGERDRIGGLVRGTGGGTGGGIGEGDKWGGQVRGTGQGDG